MTTKQHILKTLSETSVPLACHEFHVGANDAAVSARLRELAREKKVIGRVRPGTSYKEWSLSPSVEAVEVEYKYVGNQSVMW